jgi:hypothetical protein
MASEAYKIQQPSKALVRGIIIDIWRSKKRDQRLKQKVIKVLEELKATTIINSIK